MPFGNTVAATAAGEKDYLIFSRLTRPGTWSEKKLWVISNKFNLDTRPMMLQSDAVFVMRAGPRMSRNSI